MKAFLLRNVPDDLWTRFKRRASKEGRSLRFVILKLIHRYTEKGMD